MYCGERDKPDRGDRYCPKSPGKRVHSCPQPRTGSEANCRQRAAREHNGIADGCSAGCGPEIAQTYQSGFARDGDSCAKKPRPPWQAAIQNNSNDSDQQGHRRHDKRRMRARSSLDAQAKQQREPGKISKRIDKQ
jgi:hypothetical protein